MTSPLLVDDASEQEPEVLDTTAPDSTTATLPADAAEPIAADDGQPTTTERSDASVPAAPVVPPSSAPTPEPYTLRAHGKSLTLDGVQHVPGEGLRVPEGPAMQRVQTLMSRGLEMETFGRPRIRQLEHENTALQEERGHAEVHANAIVAWFQDVRKNPETLLAAIEKFDQFAPTFDARVERSQWERDKTAWERQQRVNDPTPEEQHQQVMGAVVQSAQQMLQDELGPKFKLSAEDHQGIAQRLLRRPDLYLTRVNGQLAFDDTRFAEDVEAEAQERTKMRTSLSAATDAARQNAAVRAGTVPAVTAAPAAKATPAPPRDEQGRFKTKEEWEEAMALR